MHELLRRDVLAGGKDCLLCSGHWAEDMLLYDDACITAVLLLLTRGRNGETRIGRSEACKGKLGSDQVEESILSSQGAGTLVKERPKGDHLRPSFPT